MQYSPPILDQTTVVVSWTHVQPWYWRAPCAVFQQLPPKPCAITTAFVTSTRWPGRQVPSDDIDGRSGQCNCCSFWQSYEACNSREERSAHHARSNDGQLDQHSRFTRFTILTSPGLLLDPCPILADPSASWLPATSCIKLTCDTSQLEHRF